MAITEVSANQKQNQTTNHSTKEESTWNGRGVAVQARSDVPFVPMNQDPKSEVDDLFPSFDRVQGMIRSPSDTRTREEIEKAGLKFGKKLGEGSQGTVHLVSDSQGRKYALKTISTQSAMSKSIFAISNERGESLALSFPKHENLMQTYGIFTYNKKTGLYRYESDRTKCTENEVVVGILTEFVPNAQELFDYVIKAPSLGKKELQNLGLQLGKGVAAMHQMGFLHRDLKLDNALIDDKESVKLIDFGFSRYLPQKTDRTRTVCGTPEYASPEIIQAELYNGLVDSWSFGVVLYTMAFKDFPFHSDHQPLLFKRIVEFVDKDKSISDHIDQRAQVLSSSPLFADKDFRDLLGKLICHRDKRITVAEALEHPFFTKVKD